MSLDPMTMTEEELTAALTASGEFEPYTTRAALYLVTQTALPGRRDFRELVDAWEDEASDAPALASVKWKELGAQLDEMRLGGAQTRLLRVAVSYATGEPVDLRDASRISGNVHKGYLIQAAIIATGAQDDELYSLAEGPGMERFRADRAKYGG